MVPEIYKGRGGENIMNFKKQLVTTVAASAMMLNLLAPVAFADTSITISGNGSDSSNTTTVTTTNSTTVEQSNTANVQNNVNSNADSGGNTAKDNTGGNVDIESGNATVKDQVKNDLNSNAATVGCPCGNGDTTVSITGNGSDSENGVGLSNTNKTQVTQANEANVNNSVNADASTGDNKASDNTGGNVKVYSGDANTQVGVSTTANANVAQVGGPTVGAGAGSLSAIISGNGSDTENGIELAQTNSAEVWQANSADINNHVNADAKSGDNYAGDNTGGSVTVWSGDANSAAGVDNSVNFNSADLSCGCLDDVTAKVAGNGEESDNTIAAAVGGDQGIYQGGADFGNSSDLSNCITSNGDSGNNNAKDNTGPVVGDPTYVFSGNSSSTNGVSNSGNVNVVGAPITLPGNFDFQFTFSWDQLFGSFFGSN